MSSEMAMNAPTPAISCSGLGKAYAIYGRPQDRLLEWLFPGRGPRGELFWALRDVSVSIRPGQTVGIVGRNGSGKSTLLQLIAGVLRPTQGAVSCLGRIAALLELGTGFNPEFTGRENVRLGASLLGLDPDAIEAKIPTIERFADIGQFFDHPVRLYSSGMHARLAFALIAHVDADILIVDEALAVGDAGFTQKCMRFLRAFKERGTLCFVSHDTAAVINLCDHALWLHDGAMRAFDQARAVCREYAATVLGQARHRGEHQAGGRSLAPPPPAETPSPLLSEGIVADSDCAFLGVELLDEAGKSLRALKGNERLRLKTTGRAGQAYAPLLVSFLCKDRLGQPLFGVSAPAHLQDPTPQGLAFAADFCFVLPALRAGDFAFSVVLSAQVRGDLVILDRRDDAIVVRVDPQQVTHGLLPIPVSSTYSIARADAETESR